MSGQTRVVVLTAGLALAACSKAPRAEQTSVQEATHESVPLPESHADRHVVKPAGGPRPPGRGQEVDQASVTVLKQAIESKDYATRLIAIEAIGDARAEFLLPWLEHALGDPEHDVRMAAIEALVRIRSARALALLATVRDDTTEDLDVRALAASALLTSTP